MFVEQNTESASEDVGTIQLLKEESGVLSWWCSGGPGFEMWETPRRQQAVREKEESNNRAPTSNPREQESRTQGWCAHLGLPEVVSTWSACHSPSWRGRNTHPGGNRPVATKQPLPTTLSLYPVLFTDVTHSQLPVEPAEMPRRIPRCPPSHPPSLVLF